MWFRESGGEFIVNPAWVVRAMSMACYLCGKVICRNGSCSVMREHTAGTASNTMRRIIDKQWRQVETTFLMLRRDEQIQSEWIFWPGIGH